MTSAALVVLGVLAGAAIGWAAQRLPVPAVVQSVVTVLVAWVAIAVALVCLSHQLRLEGTAGVFYAIDLGNLGWLLAAGVAAAGLHFAVGAIGASIPQVVNHRAPILGGAIGLYIGASHARALAWLARMPGLPPE